MDPNSRVVVATTRPLETFHAPAGDRTDCGRLTHGWYDMTAATAHSNACSPCTACFPRRAGTQHGR